MEAAFRTALPDDLTAIVRTYNATIPSRMVTADLEPVTDESRITWFNSHDLRRPLWVVEARDIYAGFVSLRPFYGRPAYDGVAEVAIYLETDMRGQGLGKQCLEHVLRQAPGLKLHTLLGFIFAHNIASISLFEKQGFQRWGLLPSVADMAGVMRDLLILGKKV